MAIVLKLLVLICCIASVVCWTYTEYVSVVTTQGFDLATTTNAITVSPTGPVSPTSKNVTTLSTAFNLGGLALGYFNLTVTDLYLGPNASVCTPSNYAFTCSASTTTTTSYNPFDTISTGFWIPVTLSQPSTCTQTSFTYTTSSFNILELYGDYTEFPTLLDEALNTGTGGEALFVTTYVSTLGFNLGGQAHTSTYCEIWLKNGALASIPPNNDEAYYLTNCVDPRRYLCSGGHSDSATCETDWIGTYPMITGTTGPKSTAASTTGKGSGQASRSTAKAGATKGMNSLLHGSLGMVAMLAVATFLIHMC